MANDNMVYRVEAFGSCKDFNAMLNDSRDMPKIKVITDQRTIERYGGDRMYMAPPLEYDAIMKSVPYGRVITSREIREFMAERAGADYTEPVTASIFISIAAWASEQRVAHKTPYWRTLKSDGELNDKFPGGVEAQREKLEAEGHIVVPRGRSNIRWYVKDYELVLYEPGLMHEDYGQEVRI